MKLSVQHKCLQHLKSSVLRSLKALTPIVYIGLYSEHLIFRLLTKDGLVNFSQSNPTYSGGLQQCLCVKAILYNYTASSMLLLRVYSATLLQRKYVKPSYVTARLLRSLVPSFLASGVNFWHKKSDPTQPTRK